jgi:hypothetical protein
MSYAKMRISLNEFTSDKTERTPTMNCFHYEYCGRTFSFTRVDLSIPAATSLSKWEIDSPVSENVITILYALT